jgi:hypothetical protein
LSFHLEKHRQNRHKAKGQIKTLHKIHVHKRTPSIACETV